MYYNLVSKPVDLPIDIDLIKKQVEIDFSDNSEDVYLSELARSSIAFFEGLTGTVLLTSTYELFLDCFPPCCLIQIMRKPNVAVTSIEYLVDGVFTTVPASDYYLAQTSEWAAVDLEEGKDWPTDVDAKLNSVKITFTVGYGTNFDDVPYDLKGAILQHIASMFENRGDCDCGDAAPDLTRLTYTRYTPLNLDLC